MSHHQAEIAWRRAVDERFVDSKYSRAHHWKFDGGATVAASSAVSSVPLPYSKVANVDPEEALVAAVSSCHMLMFLYLAARAGLVIDAYSDQAVGVLESDARGRRSITTVKLAPAIVICGLVPPTDALLERLHHEAHEECYIANSVRSQITVAGTWTYHPS
ncbi:MAG TPA: OsmC family protein [Steroidobacteraceae bacterium]